MVGLHVAGHLARRGYEAVTAASDDEFKIQQLKKAASLYEDTPGAKISPFELLPMLITAIAFCFLYVSVCQFDELGLTIVSTWQLTKTT